MRRMRWSIGILVLGTTVVGCSSSAYPLLTSAGASMSVATAVDAPVRNLVLYLQPNPGDRVELVSAEAIGSLDGADVRLWFSPAIHDGNGNTVVGQQLDPLAGASFVGTAGDSSGPGNTVGLVAEITPHRPGLFTITNVRVHLRINGGAELERTGLSVMTYVCAATPAPTDCPPPSA